MQSKNILIVDDNEENSYYLRFLLQAHGHKVTLASQGLQALENAKENPPHLIISDILMPVMDGFALCREWQKDDVLRQIPFIFYTATYTDNRDRDFALSLGAVRFVIKPKEPDEFIEILREVLQTSAEDLSNSVISESVNTSETVYLKKYNDVLLRKLESKVSVLDHISHKWEEDITARKQVESALLERELQYRTLANSGRTLIWTSDADGLRNEFNDPWLNFTGRTVAQELGCGWMLSVHPDDLNLYQITVESAVTKRERFCVEYRLRNQSGEYRWMQEDGVPRFNQSGQYLGYIGQSLDVTERRTIEARLRHSEKMEALGQLAGGVAHDFNNILGVVVAYTDLLLSRSDERSVQEMHLNCILKACDRAKCLASQILTFSRQKGIEKKCLFLKPLIAEVLEMQKVSTPITIAFHVDELAKPVLADSSRIHEMLLNLTTNAVSAMEDTGTLTVRLYSIHNPCELFCDTGKLPPGEYSVIEVADTGIGIEPQLLSRIFDPFFTTKTDANRTGLGLSVVMGVVKTHGGEVRVESELGKGSVFRVFLPAFATLPLICKDNSFADGL